LNYLLLGRKADNLEHTLHALNTGIADDELGVPAGSHPFPE
jgi:hypothetical protein